MIPPMLCTEVYSDEIAAEKNGTSSSTFFTDTFVNINSDQTPYICPSKDVLLDNYYGLKVDYFSCSAYRGFPYPGSPVCNSTLDKQMETFQVINTIVSTNFDPVRYSKDKSLQYYGQDVDLSFRRSLMLFTNATITASKSINTFLGHFFWRASAKESVNTTTMAYVEQVSSSSGSQNHFGSVRVLFNDKISMRRWYRTTFVQFLSEFGGLVVMVYAGLRVLTSFYHEFAKD